MIKFNDADIKQQDNLQIICSIILILFLGIERFRFFLLLQVFNFIYFHYFRIFL